MPTESFTIDTMTREDLKTAIDWAAEEGWNPGKYDGDCFWVADSGGFFAGVLDGEMVASISAVRYGETYGFIGFYIVKPEYRGRGFGIRIWNRAIEYLRGRTIGLDGVVAQQANYRKSGFEWVYANIRYQGIGGGEIPAEPNIVPLSAIPFETLAAYDRALVPQPREHFLRCWIAQPESLAVGLVENGELRGYGVLRRSRTGFRVGPLFADTPEGAERLFLHLQAGAEAGAPFFIDLPSANPAAVELTRRHGLEPGFETARMYAGGVLDLPVERVFGVTSLELG